MTHLNRDSEEYLHFIAVARAWRGGHNFYAMNKVWNLRRALFLGSLRERYFIDVEKGLASESTL